MLKMSFQIILITLVAVVFTGCKKGVAQKPTSFTASEEAIAHLSGSVSYSYSSGSFAQAKPEKTFFELAEYFLSPVQKAYAATPCPTLLSGGAYCSVVGATVTLVYSSCSFGASPAVWNGGSVLTVGGQTPVCGAYPTFVNTNDMSRTFVANTTRTMASSGVVISLDTTGSSTGWSSPLNSTGVTTAFTGAVARDITINGIHTSGTVNGQQFFDHTISSNAIAVNATNKVTSGTITVQHNLARYVATTTVVSQLGFSAGCCYPTSGAISTTYTNGDPTELVTFTAACGSVTVNGEPFTLTQCF